MATDNAARNINLNRDVTEQSRHTVEQLVDGFARQDIAQIMNLFAEDAVYCDVVGPGRRGSEYKGRKAIQGAFLEEFKTLGEHTYEASTIVAEGQTAFATWTLVLGRADNPAAPRFEGADHFALDKAGQVLLKNAWLNGQLELSEVLNRGIRPD